MRLLAVLAAVAAMVFGGARDADACACVLPDRTPGQERQHVEEQLGRAVAVFAGTVTRVDGVTARLDVETIWKGDLDEQVVMPLHDGPQPDGTLAFSSCDYVFRAGRRYLVFAYSDPRGRMRAYSCTYTADLTEAVRTVGLLDSIVTPRRTGRQVLEGSGTGRREF